MSGDFYTRSRRLHEQRHFEEIYKFNIENIKFWTDRYPYHAQWVRSVVEGLRKDNYSRMAFGTFVGVPEDEGLFCSCIVTKNPFTTYLELKNFLFFDTCKKIEDIVVTVTNALRSECIGKLLDRIITFAENRGYPKLTTELFNRNENDHQIIKWLVEKDFYITGNQARRYRQSDEIVYLSYDVNAVYGYDPFDYNSKAEWIVTRYFDGMHVYDDRETVDIIGYNTSDKLLEISRKVLKFGSRCYELPPYSHLNTSNNIIIFEEYFQSNHELKSIVGLKPPAQMKGATYIFDFSTNSFVKDLPDRLRERGSIAEYFGPKDLEKLLYEPPEPRIHANSAGTRREHRIPDLPYSRMGGFLTYSDPVRLNRDRVKSIQDDGGIPLYIKIGPKGQFLLPSQPLLFCYHMDGIGDNALKIWGYAKLEWFESVDFAAERDPNSGNRGGIGSNAHKNDAEILWEFIEAFNDGNEENQPKREPIWTKEEFEKHAKYNATCKVICLSLERIHYFEPPLLLSVLQIQSKNALEEIRNGTDVYLSSEEVARVEKHVNETPPVDHAKPDVHDVFLAHNSLDKSSVLTVAEALKRRGLHPWVDVNEIPPGHWFQDLLQAAIPKVKSAAIFLGPHGVGKWQTVELRSFISQCVERDIPVIPVLLPGVKDFPPEMIFLRELNGVKFQASLDEPQVIDRLVWGITGTKPGAPSATQ